MQNLTEKSKREHNNICYHGEAYRKGGGGNWQPNGILKISSLTVIGAFNDNLGGRVTGAGPAVGSNKKLGCSFRSPERTAGLIKTHHLA